MSKFLSIIVLLAVAILADSTSGCQSPGGGGYGGSDGYYGHTH